MRPINPDLIRAVTPIALASVGAVIGVAVLLNPSISDAKASAGFGLAGTAIAGAAGLAQTGKNEPEFSVRKHGDELEVTTPNPNSQVSG